MLNTVQKLVEKDMFYSRISKIQKAENKIDQKQTRAIKLYDKRNKIEQKANEINESCCKDRKSLHIDKIQLYSDIELRNDLVNNATKEYNYPKENVVELYPYLDNTKDWDNNVPEDCIEKFIKIDIYISERSKKYPFVKE